MMSRNSKWLSCEKALNRMAIFLKQHHEIIDVCMIDFVTQDILNKVIKSHEMKVELLKMTDEDLINLPTKMIEPNLLQRSLKYLSLNISVRA